MTTLDRYRGCLLGLAAGDAFGTTLEFTRPGTFTPLTDMVGGGPFNLKPGEWTDDTSMALCLAESLVTKKAFDPHDQMRLYVKWWREGHLSVKGRCFDIGGTTRTALGRWHPDVADPYCGPTEYDAAGNGSLMRLAPAPLAFAADPIDAVAKCELSSRTTHGASECRSACRWHGALIVAAVRGVEKDRLVRTAEQWVPLDSLSKKVKAVAQGSYRGKIAQQVSGSGYVVDTLEAALWAFFGTDSFREGALAVVNLGEDADTTGAVYGQIAGAFYGEEGIPKEWREKLAMRDLIEQRAGELHAMGGL